MREETAQTDHETRLGDVIDEDVRQRRLAFAIDAAMSARGVEDAQLAAAINRSTKTIERWRRGLTAPSAVELPALAAALGVKPAYLADPPEVPTYPLAQYLVEEAAVARVVAEGLELGVRRASGRVARLADPLSRRPKGPPSDSDQG